MFKPTFGQTNNTSAFGFSGAVNANPFGQTSMFGKTTTTGFAQPAFGTSGSTGLFGSTLPSSGGLFGSSTTTPTFGQAQTTQPSFGFGTSAQPTTNLFGTQQNTGTGLFSSTGTSAFGANKPAFGTFGGGATTNLFGAQQPTQTSTSLFGQATPTPGTGLFGSTTGSFGTANQQAGTVIKFNPITGTDSMVKNGVSQTINTRHFCITCMKEYENKSLEELRLEDYVANRKGPQQTGLFGAPAQQTPLFGSTTATTGLFGQQPTENKSLFGGIGSNIGGFGTSSANSTFGATATASNSLFGSKPTGFGTTTTSTTGFGFGATSTNNVFGSVQSKPFGTTPQTGSLFGQPTSQATTGFGTNTGFGGFGTQPNQSIGLFGNKPATTFNTTTSGFTFGANTATNTGLFGAKPATTGFGTTPTTGFGTAGFGANNSFGGTVTAPNTSLFKPATPSFGFGTNPATSLGTGTLGTSSSLFGNTAAKPGSLFGNTTSTGGLFGSSFGAGTSTFGTGLGTTGLGGSTLGSGSLFGVSSGVMPAQPVSTSTHPVILALASVPFADSPLFKNLLPASGKTDSLLKPSNALTQKALLTSQDLKVSSQKEMKIKLKPLRAPLTKKSLFEGLEETEVLSPSFTSTSSVKKLILKNRSVPLPESTTDPAQSNKENELEAQEKAVQRRVSFTLPLDSSESPSFYIRRNPLFKPQRHSTLVDLEPSVEPAGHSSPSQGVTEPVVETAEEQNQSGQQDDSRHSSKHSNSSLDETRGFLSDETSKLDEDWQPHVTGITLRRVDYYTIPSLDELVSLVADDGSCLVDNFCIGRYGYGNLYFEETMDVAGLNMDEVVHFRHKEVNVYPDDEVKPPVGMELNRKCQVTLEQVWPLDKTTREPIKDPERLLTMGYEAKLRRCTARMSAHFIEYRPITGSWVFRVDHFSKYGLSDSDDEGEDKPAKPAKPTKPAPQPPVMPIPPAVAVVSAGVATRLPVRPSKVHGTVLSPILPTKQQRFSPQHPGPSFTMNVGVGELGLDADEEMEEGDADTDESLDCTDTVHMAADVVSPSVHLARRSGVDPQRVQLMKASLFHQDEDTEDRDADLDRFESFMEGVEDLEQPLSHTKGMETLRARFRTPHEPPPQPLPFMIGRLEMSAADLEPPLIAAPTLFHPRPLTVSVVHAGTVVPYAKSALSKVASRCVADQSLFMGRCFRVGWGPQSSLACLASTGTTTRHLTSSLQGRLHDDNSPQTVHHVFVYAKNGFLKLKDELEGHLKIQLEHSQKGDQDGFPVLAPKPGVEALHAHARHALLADNDGDCYHRQVWELCVALWGNLATLSAEDEPTGHNAIMMRKNALSEWLRKCVGPAVRKERQTQAGHKASRYVSSVLSLLSGQDLEPACSESQSHGDHFAALLLASGPTAQPLLQDQLAEWQNVSADAYMDPERLRLLTLAAGLPLFSATRGLINVCSGLDWKRAFALHLWYLMPPVASIADVLKKYEAAFEGEEAYAARAIPPYEESMVTSSGKHMHDLCYHLLQLYCCKSHPLDQLLNPATYSADPLDYWLSWLVEQVLTSIGYSHAPPLCSSITNVSFAAQLEANGLWHWAVFVFLHLPDYLRRKQAVVETVYRHVVLTEERDLTAEEEFVVDELGVAEEWVYRGKATLARSKSLYHEAAHYLIQAHDWNEAHQLIMDHLAADAIINENYNYLQHLLDSLAPHSNFIYEWSHLGQLLWDYLEVVRVVEKALTERDAYQLESRRGQLASLCSRLPRWPCHSAKDRLCQSEMAKRIAHIFHSVVLLQGDLSEREVTDVISRLPLPKDYLSEELRHVQESFADT